MSKKTELEFLRTALGRGPTDMLLWIASQGGWVGSLTPRMVQVNEKRIRKYRRKLESAGLVRATYHCGHGYEYEIVRPEDLPIQNALEEWHQERAVGRRSKNPSELVTANY
ncbi:MAG TPA: hypothetical protein VJN89_00695 [Candidatus Acidoferrum sp.]|nr:hypothetical protein [Candidatus Acidoferrum sp.]